MFEETVGDDAGSEDGDEDVYGFMAIAGVTGKFGSNRGESIVTVFGIIETEPGRWRSR